MSLSFSSLVFLFLFPLIVLTLPSIVVYFFLQLSFNLHFKMTVIDISKRNPIANMTLKNVYIKGIHTHKFKDINSVIAFLFHLIPMDLQVCTLIDWLTRKSVDCVGVN